MSLHLSIAVPELYERTFTPADVGRVLGMFPEVQRLHRSRLAKAGLQFPDAPYEWAGLSRIALMVAMMGAGLNGADAWQIASKVNAQILDYDFRGPGKPPLWIVASRDQHGGWRVTSHGAQSQLDLSTPEWWGPHVHLFNFSDVQRRLVAECERTLR